MTASKHVEIREQELGSGEFIAQALRNKGLSLCWYGFNR